MGSKIKKQKPPLTNFKISQWVKKLKKQKPPQCRNKIQLENHKQRQNRYP